MRTIRDEYELPDDDEDLEGVYGLRRPRPQIGGYLVLLLVIVMIAGGLYLAVRITNEQSKDTFCLSCHTVPEQTYFNRAGSASAGAIAVDLSSFHYQTLVGQGGVIRCIDCHQGTGSLTHRVDVLMVSTRHALEWVLGSQDNAIEKGYTSAPHLANDSCLSCHAKTLLVAGAANHWHNMLAATYELWRNGVSVIAPAGTTDKQAVIAAGLVKYESSLVCSDCHRTHASQNDTAISKPATGTTPAQMHQQLESAGASQQSGANAIVRPLTATHLEVDKYLDKQFTVPEKCIQCHREVNHGPLQVTAP